MDDQATYSYDAFNRNTKVEMFNGNVQINHYDPEGLRHEMEENGRLVSFIFRGEEVVVEETKEQRIRYIRTHELVASDAKNASTYYHYAADEMGSITHVIEGESVLNHYTYDAWGVPEVCKETVENRFRFNGQQYDSVSQQYYLRARFYNPVIARFTQEDSYRGDGLNLYSYCENNPVYYIDPSGYYVCASGVERRTEDVRRRTATRDEYKSLSSHLREKLRNGKPLTPSEKAAAEKLGIDVNRKGSKSSTSTGKYQVGAYQDIKGVEGLDAHHVGQKALMKKLVADYDALTAPAINVPKLGHTKRHPKRGIISRSTKGITNARQLLARDLFELKRVYPDILNSALKELIYMNKKMYPEMRK